MPFGLRKRKRFERMASLDLPPGQWERAWTSLRRRDVLGRIGLALLAAVHVCVVIHGWEPPFAYRTGYTPLRESWLRSPSRRPIPWPRRPPSSGPEPDPLRLRARRRAVGAIAGQAANTLVELTAVPTLDKLDPKIWKEFQVRRPAEGTKPPEC